MPSPVSPQELNDFFATIVQTLERLQIPYMVAGGFAAIFYGEPRLTIDIDLVVFAFDQTGSDKHLRDVKGVLVTQWGHLDLELIRRAAAQRNLLQQFEQLLAIARREIEG